MFNLFVSMNPKNVQNAVICEWPKTYEYDDLKISKALWPSHRSSHK